ncbi:MAG: sensor histidine kinase [Oscillospiraceae bacterium]
MNSNVALARLFSSVRQAVIGTDGKAILFANAPARAVLGEDICRCPANVLLPPDILDCPSESFVCGTLIQGHEANVSVVRDESMMVLFMDFPSPDPSALYLTRHIISNLRTCAMGLKMSADRCFSILEDGKTPDRRHVSVLYHYYYCLARTLTQMDSADLLERGEMTFSPLRTDLVKLCSELCDTIANLCPESGVNISFICEESEVSAVVDPQKMEQLLLNLFSNSLQHTSAGDSISLSLSRSGNRIILSMNDNGSGIDPDQLSNIFTLPDTDFDLTHPQDGIGLGLYIANGITQLHKGVLLVESNSGAGTKIRLMLPTNETPAPKFDSPETTYRHNGVSSVLTGLADVLKSDSFGTKFED